MDVIWSAIERIASGWVVLILWVIVIVYYWYFFARNNFGVKTFDARWEGFGPRRVPKILADFTDDNLLLYRRQASTVDMLFPVLYSIAGAAAMVFFGLSPRFQWLILLPFAMAVCDYIENWSVIRVIDAFRAKQDLGSWPAVLVVAQRLKFLFFGATFAVLIVLGAMWAWRELRG
jgi:hypothetical protein